jgi:uncharacterized membrane protein YccC
MAGIFRGKSEGGQELLPLASSGYTEGMSAAPLISGDLRIAPPSATSYALRAAAAAALCLVLAEVWRLEHADLAVWTTYMVLSQYEFTAFQKGIERILGRGLGILTGLVVVLLSRGDPVASLLLEVIALLSFFWSFFAGRLTYTYLNAGLYTAVIGEIGYRDPAAAPAQGWALFLAIVLGVLVVDLVVWLTGAERDLRLRSVGRSPLRDPGSRLGRTVTLAATVLVAQLACRWLDLPASKAMISVMLLQVTPDLQALLHKGRLRIAGALAGAALALLASLLLARMPHFGLLVALLFLGIFVAAHQVRTGGSDAYFGVQMGLVYVMVLVVSRGELGNLAAVSQRLEGVAVALVASVVMAGVMLPATAAAEETVDPGSVRSVDASVQR